MKKGFTLMEMLFVALVIGLVLSFAVPAIRSVRFDAANARAKSALRKLAEARRSFYHANRGFDISEGSFVGAPALADCRNLPSAIGAPSTANTGSETYNTQYTQLFNCGYLTAKDFENLPYTFYICSSGASEPCTSDYYAVAVGNSDAGRTYSGKALGVDKNMNVKEIDEE